ncbi:sulfite exporter TauE/SafE family protein [Sodalinema gerasimenkoae]|uniref:sulfite exporter TauE/SafE family protein n=1 Tax=Sodalinema gerasimenkoae TaxID=2862348 RepID=UPI00135B545B|nr:sulfite exporter TauE/SafE family protein [Sodalinema gerasimenkoae]
MNLDYWFIFPIAVMIATIAMASGVEGATFFTPLFIIVLGLPTDVAVGTGLITEVFGFSSGLYAYVHRGLIDYKLGQTLLWVTIPVVVLGTWLAKVIPDDILKGILAVGLLAIAASFLRPPTSPHTTKQALDSLPQTGLTSRQGQTFYYRIGNYGEGRLLASIGALFLGMVSTGLGQLNGYFLLQRCRVPSPVAVATSVFVVAITAAIASVGHVLQFIQAGDEVINQVLSLVLFTIPGVLIGAQLGAIVASRLPQSRLERSMGVLFVLVGVILFGEILVQYRT